jgi:hypothetical protein
MLRKTCAIVIAVVVLGLGPETGRADTYNLEDGQTVTGDVVSCNESGLILRLPEGKYSDRVPWTKFSQADLKKLAQSAKVAPLVEPFLEVPLKEKPKKPDVQVQTPWRLKRAGGHSLFGAMFSSSVGITVLLLLYAANLYAAYEVSIFRAQPRAVVCGLAAIPVLGFLAPIIFLAMPMRLAPVADEAPAEATGAAAYVLPGMAAAEDAAGPGSLRLSQAQGGGRSTSSLPTTQVFQRGAFTFNRRFFETKFPGFFAMVRRDADKDMVIFINSARGQFTGQRISRITGNELHLHVQKGGASEEVVVPFTEIQEVQLKHKDA